jgi:hypothetical protein
MVAQETMTSQGEPIHHQPTTSVNRPARRIDTSPSKKIDYDKIETARVHQLTIHFDGHLLKPYFDLFAGPVGHFTVNAGKPEDAQAVAQLAAIRPEIMSGNARSLIQFKPSLIVTWQYARVDNRDHKQVLSIAQDGKPVEQAKLIEDKPEPPKAKTDAFGNPLRPWHYFDGQQARCNHCAKLNESRSDTDKVNSVHGDWKLIDAKKAIWQCPRCGKRKHDALMDVVEDVEPAKPVKSESEREADKWFGPKGRKDTAVSTTTAQHWITIDEDRKAFWAEANKRLATRKELAVLKPKERHSLVHELLEVEHVEDYTGTREQAIAALQEALDIEYPMQAAAVEPPKPADQSPAKDPVTEMWSKILPEFKAIRPDVTDKNEACQQVLDVLGFNSMKAAYDELGSDVYKFWADHKHEIKQKPAEQPKQPPTNGNGHKQQSKPQQQPVVDDPFADGDPFADASEDKPYLRMALAGPAGSGKTFTALKIANALIPGGKVAILDSERGSASKYRKDFSFKVLNLDNYDPHMYISAIHAAERNGYDVLIIDSLSHAWEGAGGILEMHDNEVKRQRSGGNRENSFTAWREVTPVHNALVNAILNAKIHIIVTMRSKTEYVIENGKPVKVGLAPIQRAGMEYEFDIIADLDQNNDFVVSKTRCSALNKVVVNQAGKEIAEKIRTWLDIAA